MGLPTGNQVAMLAATADREVSPLSLERAEINRIALGNLLGVRFGAGGRSDLLTAITGAPSSPSCTFPNRSLDGGDR
jgi:hypothetical protein